MKQLIYFILFAISATSVYASPNDDARNRAIQYYSLLQKYADKVEDADLIEEIEKLFIDNDGGLVYNDLMQYKDNGLENKPDKVSHYLTTIGNLWTQKDIRLSFSVNPDKFKYSTEETQKFRSSGPRSMTTYIIIEKEISGLPIGKITCNEIMAVEGGKIKTINYNDSETKLLKAIEEYKQKNYSKAFGMFKEDTERKQNSESAYWLTLMLLKNKGAVNPDTGREYPKNVRYAMALYYMSKFSMYSLLELFRVENKPNTESNTAFNDGRLIDIDSKGRIGFLNEVGRYIIPHKFQMARNFHEGLAAVAYGYNNWGFVDVNGKNITKFGYEYREVSDFHNGLAAVKNSQGKWGYIDKTGQLVIEFEYVEVSDFDFENKAKVKKNGRVFYIYKDQKIKTNRVYKHS